MRIAVLATRVGEGGGIQRYSGMVVRSLESEGYSVSLFESADWGSRAGQARGMDLFRRSLHSSDLIWVLHPRLGLSATLANAAARLPVVVSTYGFENWGAYSRRSRVALEAADVVTALSSFSAALMGSPGRKAVLLRPSWGVAPCSGPSRPLSDRRVVLFVARLDEAYKGADVVLGLAARFAEERAWRFVVAGVGGLPVGLSQRAAAHDNVEVVRNPSDARLAELLAESAVLVAPSRAQRASRNRWTGGEGFGIVLLEAAAAGVPVLASDEGACPETIALLGNGYVCRPTTDAFEPLLRSLLSNPELRAFLGQRGVVMAENFGPEAFRQRVSSVVARACARR